MTAGGRLCIMSQFRCFPIRRKQRDLPPLAVPGFEHLDAVTPGGSLTVVDLAQVQDLPLDHPSVRTSAILDDAPVPVLFAVLAALGAAEKHAAIVYARTGGSRG